MEAAPRVAEVFPRTPLKPREEDAEVGVFCMKDFPQIALAQKINVIVLQVYHIYMLYILIIIPLSMKKKNPLHTVPHF